MLAIPEREPATSRWATRAALFAFGLLVTAAFLFRLFGMPTPVAYNLAAVAMGVAVLSIACAAVAALIIWRTGRPGTARVLFAVCLSLGLIAVPVVFAMWLRDYPLINDVTTDFQNPPAFLAVAKLRGPGDNDVGYRARSAEAQKLAYPDIRPMRIDRPSEEAYALVVDAVKRLKMEIVREDPPDPEAGTPGAIEAVDRTLVMGLYEDVAVRVVGDGESARVDIRSASRFGRADMGANAEGVRELTKEIQARVDATMPTAEDARETRRAKQEKAGGPKSDRRRRSRDRER
ncbi:DUF1499 domain-containing protein [Hyphomicrobium sp. CS1GBMeth3]|uniref:DUF1499 domain-containing protein n=1 Tax=Hyphomicrobium sp. CS1GBMeth3 TaxID=1892845 RepID=UPI000930D5D7|nr:DUF1499 domain-containing protein [Hyphomicrobium sp. CS1GBMeth3]